MRRSCQIAVVLVAVAWSADGFAQPPPTPVVPAATADDLLILPTPPADRRVPLDATWDNGLIFKSPDDEFRFHGGGVGQIDSVWLIGPKGNFAPPGGGTNGVENSAATQLRRVILQVDGTVYRQFDYMLQYDFANASNDNNGLEPPSFGNLTSSPAPHNIWMQVRDVPYLGIVRVGYQDKPIGMTAIESGKYLGFMERPDNNDAFYGPFDNGFAPGITVRNWSESERLTWQTGVYRPATNVFGVTLNKGAYGGRVTGLPVYADDGERLIHFGFGTFWGELPENVNRNRARPLLRNGPGFAVPVLADTGDISGSRQYTFAPEFAAVLGSLTIRAEWAGQFLTHAAPNGQPPQGTVFYHGGYAEALYFLTGEHQEYDKKLGAFGRVIPRTNFRTKPGDDCRGFGAWQVGARFSYLDLTDKAIQGGQVYDWTVGLNWFLNPNMKVQFNYIAEHRDAPPAGVNGWINGIGIRAGYDF
jgi:phosphate-selective porin OprO/OprP